MVASSFLHHVCGVMQTSAPQIRHKCFMTAVPKPTQSSTASGQDMVTSPVAVMGQAGAAGSKCIPPHPDSCRPQPVCARRQEHELGRDFGKHMQEGKLSDLKVFSKLTFLHMYKTCLDILKKISRDTKPGGESSAGKTNRSRSFMVLLLCRVKFLLNYISRVRHL